MAPMWLLHVGLREVIQTLEVAAGYHGSLLCDQRSAAKAATAGNSQSSVRMRFDPRSDVASASARCDGARVARP
jgi:hypothetical protein